MMYHYTMNLFTNKKKTGKYNDDRLEFYRLVDIIAGRTGSMMSSYLEAIHVDLLKAWCLCGCCVFTLQENTVVVI